MKISGLHTLATADLVVFSCDVTRADGFEFKLTFTVRPPPDGLVLDRADAFFLPCLLIAMVRGEDLEVVPPVSARLVHNAVSNLVPVLGRLRSLPEMTRIRAHQPLAESFDSNTGVLTGFSAGVDSFACLHDHFLRTPLPEYRITHLLFNDVGSHGVLVAGRKTSKGRALSESIYSKRLARVRKIAQELQLPLIRISSNMDELLDVDFLRSHTLRNTSAALVLQSLCSKFFYASTFEWQDIHIQPAKDIAHADPVLLPLMSTESMECLASGTHYRRVDKVRLISEMDLARRSLDVCWLPLSDQINCGRCRKCLRTLLALEILGYLDDFAEVFSLDAYFRARSNYLSQVLASDHPLERELVDLAKSERYRFGVGAHLRRHVSRIPFRSALPGVIKRPLKALLGYS